MATTGHGAGSLRGMGFGFFFFLWMLFLGALTTIVGVPQLFSMPPRPEAPALLRMVPADTVVAVTWAGAATASAQSKNRTEQLCAEPEVRRTTEALRDAMRSMLAREGAGAASIATAAFDFVCAALQRPGCAFLRTVELEPQRKLEAGLALQLDESMPAAKALLGVLSLAMQTMASEGERHEDIEVADLRFRALPTPADKPFVGWAETDGWLLVACGEPVAQLLVDGLHDRAQGLRGREDVQTMLQATAVARPAWRTFIDAPRLLAALTQIGGAQATATAAALGLGATTTCLSTTGLDGDGFAARAVLTGKPTAGLLAALVGPAIAQDALLAVPADADLAIALRCEPALLASSVFALFGGMVGYDAAQKYDEFQAEFERDVGVSWLQDLLQHLDGQLTAWNAPSQGGLGITATTWTLGLRNGAAFAPGWRKIIDKLAENLPSKAARRARGERRLGRDSFLESFEWRGQTVHWIDSFDSDTPFAVALTAGPQLMAGSLTPAALRSTLDAAAAPNPDRSLVRWPALNKRGKATLLVHYDAKSLLTSGWPLLMLWLQATTREWQSEGFDFDAADLPAMDAVLPHLGRELQLLEPTATGLVYSRTGTLPAFDPLTVAAIAAAAVLLSN